MKLVVHFSRFAFLSVGLIALAIQNFALHPVENEPPQVKIALPVEGAIFTAPASIHIAAQATDHEEAVITVEFFANGQSLGVTTNDFRLNSPINPFQITWSDVPAGEYTLTAKATDAKQASTLSEPVKIFVKPASTQIEVSVATLKGEASEIGDSKSRTLIFQFIRAGNREIDLPVFYSVHGTATMGQDYPELDGKLLIPKGAEVATLSFEVKADSIAEANESVIVRVEPPACIELATPPPDCYKVGARPEAHAVILGDVNTVNE
ncbi:MAG: Ig-like domain-containing protein, partial [Verrucomicrobiota bacterium]